MTALVITIAAGLTWGGILGAVHAATKLAAHTHENGHCGWSGCQAP